MCHCIACLDLPNGVNEPLPENVEAFEAHLLKTMKDIAENAKEMSVSILLVKCEASTASVCVVSALQTPGFSPPAPAPARAKKTPAPGKKLRLRQKTCEN